MERDIINPPSYMQPFYRSIGYKFSNITFSCTLNDEMICETNLMQQL